jgi:diketogulonate reductase-like aldo/keto reductase
VSGLQSGHPDNKIQRHLTWRALTQCHNAGLIKSIGVSNFLVRHLIDLKSSGIVPAVNQVEWHPHHHDNELLKYCRETGIFLQAYSSLGSSNAVSLRHDPKVAEIAKKLSKSPAQVLLRWAFQNEIGILPKGSSREHIEENIDLDFVLPDWDVKVLGSLKVNEKYAWDPSVVA